MSNRPEPPPSDTNPGVEIKEGGSYSFWKILLDILALSILVGSFTLAIYALMEV